MEQDLAFLAFTVLPGVALVLGAAYSLQEVYRIGEKRIILILLVLGFMLFHQVGEAVFFLETGQFRDSALGDAPETAANVIASVSVYYVLAFTRKERNLKNELEASQSEREDTKERLELIFENVNDGVLLVDMDNDEIIEANRSVHRLLRYEQGDIEGMSPYDLHPHEPERFRELTKALRADGGLVTDSLSCRRSDGSTMPADVSVSHTTLNGCNLMLVTIRDNTEREQYRTQTDLLGRVLRHNLRNDMSVIMGNLISIERRVGNTDLEALAEKSIRKCEGLLAMSDNTRKLNDILDSEREQIGMLVDLVPLVEEVVSEYDSENPRATVEADLPDTATVQASANVTWAIENIVENALEHAESDPELRVEIRTGCVRDEVGRSEWTTFTVADRGPGIPEHEVQVLEDDTNRTSKLHGSGLGLWIVQQIAEVFDGKLDIDHSPDSEFTTEVSLRLQPGEHGYEPASNKDSET